jgi:hypothetical protein
VYASDQTSWVVTANPGTPPPSPTSPTGDVTGLMSVSPGRPAQRGGGATQTLTIRNTSGTAVAGPLSVLLSGLPRKVKLRQAGGAAAIRSARGGYALDIPGALAPGGTQSLVLKFSNPTKKRFRYSVRVLAGPGQG